MPVYRTRSDLVLLHVNVVDGRSDAVADLPQSAFEVLEDGTPQTVSFFDNHDMPVAVGLALDASSSMITRRAMISAAVRAFGSHSRDDDELFTIVFNEHVRFGLPADVPFTTDRERLRSSLDARPIGGRTALYDAVIEGLDHLDQSRNQKRVLLVLSDGDDNASGQSQSNMFYRASQSGALIYTVWTGDLSSVPGNPKLLQRLATRNGGLAYRPRNEAEVVRDFTAIATNVRRGYSLGYVPTNTKTVGSYRRVTVRARHGGRALNVRARDGYMAPDDGPVTR